MKALRILVASMALVAVAGTAVADDQVVNGNAFAANQLIPTGVRA